MRDNIREINYREEWKFNFLLAISILFIDFILPSEIIIEG